MSLVLEAYRHCFVSMILFDIPAPDGDSFP
jgi:hypothetical protein